MTARAHREGEVTEALAEVTLSPIRARPDKRRDHADKTLTRARRIEALNMRITGHSIEEIAKKFGISTSRASAIILEMLDTAENLAVSQYREIENARLDVAQAAIWPKVKKGNLGAVDSFIRLSARRARMNGLDAPQRVDISGNVRLEMERALDELTRVLKEADIVDAEVVEDEPLAIEAGDDDHD